VFAKIPISKKKCLYDGGVLEKRPISQTALLFAKIPIYKKHLHDDVLAKRPVSQTSLLFAKIPIYKKTSL
jgi:hypothetical protein